MFFVFLPSAGPRAVVGGLVRSVGFFRRHFCLDAAWVTVLCNVCCVARWFSTSVAHGTDASHGVNGTPPPSRPRLPVSPSPLHCLWRRLAIFR